MMFYVCYIIKNYVNEDACSYMTICFVGVYNSERHL